MKGEYIDYKGVTTEAELAELRDTIRNHTQSDPAKITDEMLIVWKRLRGMNSSAAMAQPKKVRIWLQAARKALSPATGHWLVMIRVKPDCDEAPTLKESDIKKWVEEQFHGCDLGDVEVVKIEQE